MFAVGLWNLISVFLSFILVDRIGRMKLMSIGMLTMTLGSFMLGVGYEFFQNQSSIIAIGGILIYILGFEIGPGPLFFVIASEVYPTKIKGKLSYNIFCYDCKQE